MQRPMRDSFDIALIKTRVSPNPVDYHLFLSRSIKDCNLPASAPVYVAKKNMRCLALHVDGPGAKNLGLDQP